MQTGREAKERALGSGTALSWLSMNGRFRSHSGGGRSPHSGLLRSRTPVYRMTGVPSASTMQHPEKQPSASAPPGLGSSAGGRCSQYTRSSLAAWPHTMPKSHSQPFRMCW